MADEKLITTDNVDLKPLISEDVNSIFFDITAFESAQRIAKMLATSDFIPKEFQGKIQNIIIALEYAHRNKTSPLQVMQEMYIVYGKPSFSAKYLIALLNGSRRFATPLDYEISGEGDDCGCIAFASTKVGSVCKSPRVTIKMAKDEGWFSRNGSKWKTMPDLMLRYRAATMFINLYAPDVKMGIKSTDEILDAEYTVLDEYKVTKEVEDKANKEELDIELPTDNKDEKPDNKKKDTKPADMTKEEEKAILDKEKKEADPERLF